MVLSHLDELIFPCVKRVDPFYTFHPTDHRVNQLLFDYSHPFRIVCQAFTLRYPNPFAPHVITVDTIERNWDAESGILRSSRLVLKRGTLPSWAPKGILEKSDTWVLEESTINLLEGTMTLSNRNLDHRRVMEVVEKTSLRARGEV
jgi:hypothetical protein